MYTVETQASFDSAHFLAGYFGKCSNIHGHRWNVKVELAAKEIQKENVQTRGMLMDFSSVKEELRNMVDELDHALIIEQGSLREATYQCLKEDKFKIIEVDFRPTAENFAEWFYVQFDIKGYPVHKVTVYETPNNCATFCEE